MDFSYVPENGKMLNGNKMTEIYDESMSCKRAKLEKLS